MIVEPVHMTPEEVNRIRFEVLGIGVGVLADRLGLAKGSGVQYIKSLESGKKAPSGPVALALRYMAQDWIHKDDRMPIDGQKFEIWEDSAQCLVTYCYVEGGVVGADDSLPGDIEWTYWRACTRPPPGLTMETEQGSDR